MEKEIEQIIRAAMYERLAAGTVGAMEPIVQSAAHAIAEAMREGVVWEGTGQILHGLNSTSVSVPGAGRLTLEDNWGDARLAVHGQRVHLTVRVEDRSG